ncbi:MAG: 3'-5' exonuclease [Solobacterium sp.]|nr:3'-5' exonuclease [Solobacterium sp.]
MSEVTYTKLKLTRTMLEKTEQRFIAFDTETTGLDSYYDRIIEVGAVLFENGQPVKQFNTLVHSVNHVPYDAYMVNHISDREVQEAPPVTSVYPALLEFFGDAVNGNTILVGHNATFDMKFLAAEMNRLDLAGDFLYVDTCALSRKAVPDLYSHTQDTVARHFGIRNRQSHRAVTDALTCGSIMTRLIPMLKEHETVLADDRKREAKRIRFEPDDGEKELCAFLFQTAHQDICFQKNGKLLNVRAEEPLFSLCLTGRHPYLVTRQCYAQGFEAVTPCSSTEARMYPDGVRIMAEEDVQAIAGKLLATILANAEIHKPANAAELYDAMRSQELYWKPSSQE